MARAARLAIGLDFRLDRRQSAHRLALEGVEKRRAAGTRRPMIRANIPRVRETGSSPGRHGGRKRCAGAWTPEPEIGLVRHQQRHKTYPEYGSENHKDAIPFIDTGSMKARLCAALKFFAKFETNSPGIAPFSRVKTMRDVRFRSASIQKRGVIVSCLPKIRFKNRDRRPGRAMPRSI